MQHCTDLPRQVTFPAHTEQGKMGARVRINVTAHQEKEKNEETKKGRRKEKEKADDRLCRSCVLPVCGRSGGSIAKK